jgi:hypothetical protein
MIIEIATAGTAKINAKKNARADFLLCKVTDWASTKREAEYPAFSTILIKSFGLISAGAIMWAVSVAKLIVALTPSTLLSAFSTELTHEEHVIPCTDSVTGSSS